MTHTKDTREAIARLIGDAAYDAGASVFDTRAVADAILSHLTALESAPAQAGGDVRELVADLIDFEAKCDADLDDRRGAGKTVFVEDIMHERLLEMNLDTPADIVRHFADPIRAALTATPAQAERSTPDKVALKNKIVSAILSYPPDTMSKAEFMADQILAAIPAQPTPSGEVDGLVAEIGPVSRSIQEIEAEVWSALRSGLTMGHTDMRKAIEAPRYEIASAHEDELARTLADRVMRQIDGQLRTALGGGWRDDMENGDG